MKKAYISVITNKDYYDGLRIMAASLKDTGTKVPLYVVVPGDLDTDFVEMVKNCCDGIISVSDHDFSIPYKDENKTKYWNNTFFKLNIMNLTDFDKIIYIDSDMLVLNNLDSLFEYPGISATTGGKSAHPEYIEFNSGIMVIEPNKAEFDRLLECITPAIERKKSMDKGYGDQDVFNEFYKDWHDAPDHNFGEEYNALCAHVDTLMKAKGYKNLRQLSVLHYVGPDKIWNNSVWRNLRLIIRYIHEGRIYTAKSWWMYMKRMSKTGVKAS